MKLALNFGPWARCVFLAAAGILGMGPTPCNLRIPEIPGSSEKQGREGTIDVFAIDHELVQPIDPASGAPSERRQHRPLTILKEIDRASPKLHAALARSQRLPEVGLDFYRIDPATRMERKYYEINLRNVRIIGMKTLMPTSFLPENQSYEHMEEVRMVYEGIEWRWLPTGDTEGDTWQDRPAAEHALESGSPAPVTFLVTPATVRPEPRKK